MEAFDGQTVGKTGHTFRVYELRRMFFRRDKGTFDQPNNHFLSCILLLFSNDLIRKSIKRASQVKEEPCSNRSQSVLMHLGQLFECFSAGRFDVPQLHELYMLLIENKDFQTFYSPNKMKEYMLSFLQVIDCEVKLPICDRITEVVCAGKDNQGRSLSQSVIVSEYFMSQFNSQRCEKCQLTVENQQTHQSIGVKSWKTTLKDLRTKLLGQKGSSLFGLKAVLAKREPVKLEQLLSEFVRREVRGHASSECPLCRSEVVINPISRKVLLPNNLLFEFPDCMIDSGVELQTEVELITEDRGENHKSKWKLSFLETEEEDSVYKNTYLMKKGGWFKVGCEAACAVSEEFIKSLKDMSKVRLLGFRKCSTGTMQKSSCTGSSAISIPLPVMFRYSVYGEPIRGYLQSLFCDHCQLNPSLFELNFADKQCLDSSIRTATALKDKLSVVISKKEFADMLYKESLLEAYLFDFQKLRSSTVCERCCDIHRRKMMLDVALTSIKVQCMENQKTIDSNLVIRNHDFFSSVFENRISCAYGLRSDQVAMERDGSEGQSVCEQEGVKLRDSVAVLLNSDSLKEFAGRKMNLVGQFERLILETIRKSCDSSCVSTEEVCVENYKAIGAVLESVIDMVECLNNNWGSIVPLSQMKVDRKLIDSAFKELVFAERERPKECLSTPFVSCVSRKTSKSRQSKTNGQMTMEGCASTDENAKQRNVSNAFKKYYSANSDYKKIDKEESGCWQNSLKSPRNPKLSKGDKLIMKKRPPVIQIDSDCSQNDPLTSPATINSIWKAIEIPELKRFKETNEMHMQINHDQPSSESSSEKDSGVHTPNSNKQIVSKHIHNCLISDENISEDGVREATPVNPNVMQFFEDSFQILKEGGVVNDPQENLYRPGVIHKNRKSTFWNPKNNTIVSQFSKSEISSFYKSLPESIPSPAESADPFKFQIRKLKTKIKRMLTQNLKLMVANCTDRIRFERVNKVEKLSMKNSGKFMLVLNKSKTEGTKEVPIINLASPIQGIAGRSNCRRGLAGHKAASECVENKPLQEKCCQEGGNIDEIDSYKKEEMANKENEMNEAPKVEVQLSSFLKEINSFSSVATTQPEQTKVRFEIEESLMDDEPLGTKRFEPFVFMKEQCRIGNSPCTKKDSRIIANSENDSLNTLKAKKATNLQERKNKDLQISEKKKIPKKTGKENIKKSFK